VSKQTASSKPQKNGAARETRRSVIFFRMTDRPYDAPTRIRNMHAANEG